MSRVHISFVERHKNCFKSVFDVVSPDFSETGTIREVIGRLDIDLQARTLEFTPADNLPSNFCPPELFQKHLANIDMVEEVCKREGLLCSAWSYRIYRKAQIEME